MRPTMVTSDRGHLPARSRSSAVESGLEVAVLASAGVAAVFSYSFASAWLRRGAPFVPTAKRKIDRLFAANDGILSRIPRDRRREMHVIDLGSGGGALVRAAIRQGGFGRATGYEINPALVALSWLQSATGEAYRLQSLWEADLSDADVCLVYGVPSMLGELGEKCASELPAGSYVVSNIFRIPQAPPIPDDGGQQQQQQQWQRQQRPRRKLTQLDSEWIDAGGWSSMDDAGELFLYRVMEDDE